MADACPVDGQPLPPYTFGRPRTFCSDQCRPTAEGIRARLPALREQLAYEESRVQHARRHRRPNLDGLLRFEAMARAELEAAERILRVIR